MGCGIDFSAVSHDRARYVQLNIAQFNDSKRKDINDAKSCLTNKESVQDISIWIITIEIGVIHLRCFRAMQWPVMHVLQSNDTRSVISL